MAGYNPKKVKRPTLTVNSKGWKTERAIQEIKGAMDHAYRMAVTGNADRIFPPLWQYGPGQPGW